MPADCALPLDRALANQDGVQPLYTTGTVFHIYVDRELEEWQRARDMIRQAITGHELPCVTLSPVYTICQSCGYLPGNQPVCPKCGAPTDVYSRIAGYYRPVQDWNEGKAQEFKNRVMFKV